MWFYVALALWILGVFLPAHLVYDEVCEKHEPWYVLPSIYLICLSWPILTIGGMLYKLFKR